jgi:ABC-2 type transport system ATP-binding protein
MAGAFTLIRTAKFGAQANSRKWRKKVNAIEIRGLRKDYRGKKGEKIEALKNLDLQIGAAEVFGFLGPNGAGKSTTIKTLMGLITPTAGVAMLFDVPVKNHSARKRVGYLPENPSFYDFLSGKEYLTFVGKAFGMNDTSVAMESERVLRLMELRDASHRPIRSYSKGMVQRLGLAQALLHDPDLYVLDEPMSGLDPMGRALVKDIIKDLKGRGKTVFFSTHITSDVETVCDRVGVIVKGQLKAIDNVTKILKRGIEGYHVQVAQDINEGLVPGFKVTKKSPDMSEVYVPKEKITEFLDVIAKTGVKIELIEPKRKDIEAFFLEIVSENL